MNVANRKWIRRLSWKSLRAARTRSLIAVLAIALTTVLFTALFTIALSINDGFQQANFRQVGGWSHGGFKYLTEEQFLQLRDDPLIREWGLRRFVGMPTEVPFNKSHVEIGYSDPNQAHWMYCDPVEGRLPAEGTEEAATDTRVLELLGITPELGAEFTLTFEVDGRETTQTFTLCGWWEYDEAVTASHVLIPHSRVEAVLAETGVTPPGADGMTGSWNMEVMLKSGSRQIARDLEEILEHYGYQGESRTAGDNYIDTGVNWGYTGAQFSENLDLPTVLAVAALALLIGFTGYLIIYNVFQISVTNDIRFYGLLKTIGTTPRQLRRVIRHQALALSLAGIPLGLAAGWLVGGQLTPVVIAQLNGVVSVVSVDPAIFLLAALFSLVTVFLSCRKPGRMAGRVSPVEAVRYTEGGAGKKTRARRASGGVSLLSMARANLGRSRVKTAVTITSLALAVVLLNVTATFANSFDMDKYVANFTASDFIVADAGQFQTGGDSFNGEMALPQALVDEIDAQGGVTEGGKVYGKTSPVEEFVTEEYYRTSKSWWYDAEQLDSMIRFKDRNEAGLLADTAQIYGMEPFALDHLRVLEGDLSKLYEPGGNYVAAVYSDNDYGEAEMDSHWAKLGSTVTLRYVEEYEYYDPDTGEVYPEDADLSQVNWASRAVKYQDVEYEVAALVTVPSALSYRYYGADEFVMNDQTFIRDTGTDGVMYYAFDTTDQDNAAMEAFLADYTGNVNPQFDYESKATYAAEFESFRSMFLLLGGVLSLIVGLVGVLNFFNAILTGIITRKREFAVLQSIGMTGRQLKTTLVYEGLLYAMGAVAAALVLTVGLSPLLGKALGSMFWFLTYRFTVVPILLVAPAFALLGVLVPLGVYRSAARRTIVERLREAEQGG